MSTNVLVFSIDAKNFERLIAPAHPELAVQAVESLDEAEALIGDCEILLSFGGLLRRDVLARARRLKWVQSLGTGVDGIVDSPHIGRDVIVTAARGMHGAAMAEMAVLGMLALGRGLLRFLDSQRRHRWEPWGGALLHDKTVGILGVGRIAEEIAPRCKALGMRVIGVSRTERAVAGIDWIVARERLEEICPELDYLLSIIPLSDATRGIVSRRILSALKPSAYFINLARGAVVDQDALVDALLQRRIAGAMLDTMVGEPPPPEHVVWSLPNTIITPHVAGYYDFYAKNVVAQFEHNLRMFFAGTPEAMLHRETPYGGRDASPPAALGQK